MPKQSWILMTCMFVVAGVGRPASAADGMICLTPQFSKNDVTKVQIVNFLNSGGKAVIDKGDADPLPPVTLRDFQLAFGEDGWKQGDSLPGGTNGKIRIGVAFLDGTTFQKEAVKKYASEWLVASGAGKIEFVFEDSSRKHIRITFNVPLNVNQSTVGRQATFETNPSTSTMSLGDVREDVAVGRMQSVIRHEFGHALGMRHEHQHPAGGIKWNKPKVEAELATYGWDADMVQRNIFEVLTRSYVCRGAPNFDPGSIMMYPIRPGWTLDGYTVGTNTEIVQADLQCVHSLYE